MAGNPTGTPLVLLHHVKANKVLHETVVLLSIITEEVPYVADAERLEVREIGEGVWRGVARYGYMESPDVSALIERIREPRRAAETVGGDLLFQPRDDHHRRRRADVGVAKTFLRLPQPQRPPGARLLPAAADADHRGRFADPAVASFEVAHGSPT